MGPFLAWLILRFLMACGCVVSVICVVLLVMAVAAVLVAGDCKAVELRRVREIEADEETGVDVEA